MLGQVDLQSGPILAPLSLPVRSTWVAADERDESLEPVRRVPSQRSPRTAAARFWMLFCTGAGRPEITFGSGQPLVQLMAESQARVYGCGFSDVSIFRPHISDPAECDLPDLTSLRGSHHRQTEACAAHSWNRSSNGSWYAFFATTSPDCRIPGSTLSVL